MRRIPLIRNLWEVFFMNIFKRAAALFIALSLAVPAAAAEQAPADVNARSAIVMSSLRAR